ncbi:CAP domain-containing protein [Patulibacter sp.]|uniref:CAP domain-containing protein n=1 Tax=Patulibacter sp. TaxID=1912859 RepID=UPI002715691A|nr:CAP domain-containing protein [Patulibacter sp.]MDO9408352.1 CAP domain-containing protein [Patulibacter sp.]
MPVRTPRLAVALGVATVAVLAAAPGASAATTCPDADAAPATVGVARSAAALGCLVNHERGAAGLLPVAAESRAAQAAQWHADDMAARGFFAHDAPPVAPHGTDVGDRLTNAGYTWTLVGENIARGQDTPRSVMTAWLASAGHCANIMRPGFTDAGFGISTAGNGPYWAQVFARPMGVAAPSGPAVSCPRAPAVPAPTGDAAPSASQPAAAVPGPATVVPTTPPATAGTAATATPAAPTAGETPKVSGLRTRRRLTVRVTVPAGAGPTRVVVRVRQRGAVVRTRTVTRAAGTHRLTFRLPAAHAGRITVRVGTRTVTAAFR